MSRKDGLIAVFQDTLAHVSKLGPAEPSIRYTGRALTTYTVTRVFPSMNIEVKNTDCMDEVACLRREHGAGARIGLLNMASTKNVGGGVTWGSKAQEEGAQGAWHWSFSDGSHDTGIQLAP